MIFFISLEKELSSTRSPFTRRGRADDDLSNASLHSVQLLLAPKLRLYLILLNFVFMIFRLRIDENDPPTNIFLNGRPMLKQIKFSRVDHEQ